MKKTVVIGATPNSSRYAYLAAHKLKEKGHEVIPVGIREGTVAGEAILQLANHPPIDDVDTVTMYIAPHHQSQWEEYILSLKPNRIIFNPGSENSHLAHSATSKGIEVISACTLVMLSAQTY